MKKTRTKKTGNFELSFIDVIDHFAWVVVDKVSSHESTGVYITERTSRCVPFGTASRRLRAPENLLVREKQRRMREGAGASAQCV